jgi:hypothetical protein
MFSLNSVKEASSFYQRNQQSNIFFKLTGGLGNQLFGLSEAYLMSSRYSLPVVIDISEIDHQTEELPAWLNFIESHKNFSVIQSNFKFADALLLKEHRIDKMTQIHRDKLSDGIFLGWIPDINRVVQSQLFKRGKFPFDTTSKIQSPYGIHIRGGDFWNWPSIGILSTDYYERAHKLIYSISSLQHIPEINTDDINHAEKILRFYPYPSQIVWSKYHDSMSVLDALRQYDFLVCANSTLSFWGSFFSKDQISIFPREFYLDDTNWSRKLFASSNTYFISRFANRRRQFQNALYWKFKKRYSNLASIKRGIKKFFVS